MPREFGLVTCRAATLAALLYAASASAADVGSFGYSFDVFGTAGVVHSSEDRADFVSNAMQPAGPGHTHAWSATPDSKVGAQVTGTLPDRLSAVVQVVSQYQSDGTYKPDLEWANLKYQITPDADLRFGRIALPTFMFSDSVNVGYTLPYVRMPLELYLQLPVAHSDGLDGSYRFHIGDTTTTVQAFMGRFDSNVPQGSFNARDLHGVVSTFEDDALTVHLGYQRLRYDFTQKGTTFVTWTPQSMITLGASYDPGKWYVLGEWLRAPNDALGLFYGGYLYSGYRFDKLTPYTGYARVYRAQTGYTDYPAYVDQRTNSLGLRWDFARHIDAKIQLDHTVLHGGLNAFFLDQQPDFPARGTVNILSLTVDFVW